MGIKKTTPERAIDHTANQPAKSNALPSILRRHIDYPWLHLWELLTEAHVDGVVLQERYVSFLFCSNKGRRSYDALGGRTFITNHNENVKVSPHYRCLLDAWRRTSIISQASFMTSLYPRRMSRWKALVNNFRCRSHLRPLLRMRPSPSHGRPKAYMPRWEGLGSKRKKASGWLNAKETKLLCVTNGVMSLLH